MHLKGLGKSGLNGLYIQRHAISNELGVTMSVKYVSVFFIDSYYWSFIVVTYNITE